MATIRPVAVSCVAGANSAMVCVESISAAA